MNPKISMALCGGLMVGVSIPVIFAASGNIVALIFGVAMFVSGALLLVAIRSEQTKY